jgi:hypothetical protein
MQFPSGQSLLSGSLNLRQLNKSADIQNHHHDHVDVERIAYREPPAGEESIRYISTRSSCPALRIPRSMLIPEYTSAKNSDQIQNSMQQKM